MIKILQMESSNAKMIFKIIQFIYFVPLIWTYFKYLKMKFNHFENVPRALFSITIFEIFKGDSESILKKNKLTISTLILIIIGIISQVFEMHFFK
jgi:hypothetical protein